MPGSGWPWRNATIAPCFEGLRSVLQKIASEAAVRGLNHLLAREAQARDCLRPHAGRVARIESAGFALQFSIGPDGLLQATDAEPNVTIALHPRAVPSAMKDPSGMLRDAQVSGDAELAQALSQVAARLRPDLEEDLSRFIGDAAAVRVMSALRTASEQVSDAGQRLARNVADYLAGEQRVLVSKAPMDEFAVQVAELAQAVEALADRVGRLR
jgi:ubiquinone biosynthesis accessory factor UbiJ